MSIISISLNGRLFLENGLKGWFKRGFPGITGLLFMVVVGPDADVGTENAVDAVKFESVFVELSKDVARN